MKTLLIVLLLTSVNTFADGIILNTNNGDIATYNTYGNTTTVQDLSNDNSTIIYYYNK